MFQYIGNRCFASQSTHSNYDPGAMLLAEKALSLFSNVEKENWVNTLGKNSPIGVN